MTTPTAAPGPGAIEGRQRQTRASGDDHVIASCSHERAHGKEVITMLKTTARYVRYLMANLSTLAFGIQSN
jgi:hypothetical protein